MEQRIIVKMVKPEITDYNAEEEITITDDYELWEAINDYHLNHISKGLKLGKWNYAIIEVDGEDRFLSRVAISGIGRYGGIKRRELTLDEVCKTLGIKEYLLDDVEWTGGDGIG